MMRALGDQDWRVRHQAVDALVRESGQDALTVFVRRLCKEHRDAAVLNSILQVLISIGPAALPALAKITNDPDAEVRMYAALALGNLGDSRAVSPLMTLLRDFDTNVRYHAIESLAKLKAAEAVDDLAAIAASGDFFLAFAALDALADIGEPRIAPSLLPLLQNNVLQAAVVRALAEIGDERVVPALVSLLEKSPIAPELMLALARLHERTEKLYAEGGYVSDLVRKKTSAAAAQTMLSMLNGVSGAELRALVQVLGWVGTDHIITELTRLLGSSDVRNEVIETLVRHGRHVTEGLCEQLKSDDSDTRRAAVTALARIGDAQTVGALLKALADPDLTEMAAGALAKIGDPQAYEPLLALLGHDRAAVRQAAIAALNSLGHPRMAADINKLLFHSNPHVRESAVRISGYFGYPDCADQLLDRIHDVSENVRRAAVENLCHLQDDRIFDALLRASRDESPKIRASAAQSLGFLENMRALPELTRALTDQDSWVRYYAARSLGRIGSPEAIDALACIVHSDPANQVRIAAADALGSIGGARVVSVLAPLVDSEDRDVARAGLKALGAVGHPDAIHPILEALQSPDPARRSDAVTALTARQDEAAVQALERTAAEDADPGVSETAIVQLAVIATPLSVEALIRLAAARHLRDAAIGALARLNPAHIDRLASALNHPDAEVRRAVVEAVSRMKHPRASELLGRALEDEAPAVRLAAVFALKRMGSRTAERRMSHMVRSDPDPAVRKAAEQSLER